jgi:hypothetical protein
MTPEALPHRIACRANVPQLGELSAAPPLFFFSLVSLVATEEVLVHRPSPDGQFAHGRHAQIARRAIWSHHFGIAEIPKSMTRSAHPASTRGTLRPIVTKREAGKRWTRWRA